jgi:hypothetical protein
VFYWDICTSRTKANAFKSDEQAAKLDGCHVVSLSWVLDSVKAKKKVAEEDHFFDTITASITNGSDATAAINDTNSVDDKSDSQNSKVTSKKRSRAVEARDSEVKSKKTKDGQKVSSRNVVVEVDECYPAPGERHVSYSLNKGPKLVKSGF